MPVINALLLGRDAEMHSAAHLAQRDTAEILSVTGLWCFLSLAIVGMRIYVRAFKSRIFGPDDWTVVVTAMLGLGIWICFVGESYWALGRHYELITVPALEMFLRWQFAHSLFILVALMLVKISVALFFLRLAARRSYRIFLYSLIGMVS